jgi:hypothetical protein
MDKFAKLAADERRPYLEETASHRNSTNTAIEKDFWVCWTLLHLFSLQGVPKMCFKGGTSLSKVFKLIHRFSEDIDVSLDRAALGFTGKRDLADKDLSSTKRKQLDKQLREAIQNEVTTKILPQLTESFASIIGKTGWSLQTSAEVGEEMTLLFSYPNTFEYTAYLQSQIKIEFGRGDQWPSKPFPVAPYVAEEFADIFTIPNVVVPVLDCQRTFWEKVTLLHAENHRPDPQVLKLRMSRHWSDIAVISIDDMFATEKLDLELLTEVVKFKKIHFASSWANYDSAFPGTMKLVPNEVLHKLLRDDYKAMREMFVDEPLSFNEVLERLRVLEARINAIVKAP